MKEKVNHPAHYNSYSVECIEMMRRIWGDERTITFCEMNAYKYRMRAGLKGDAVEDLKKERWYLDKIKEIKESKPQPLYAWNPDKGEFESLRMKSDEKWEKVPISKEIEYSWGVEHQTEIPVEKDFTRHGEVRQRETLKFCDYKNTLIGSYTCKTCKHYKGAPMKGYNIYCDAPQD